MDGQNVTAKYEALVSVQDAVDTMTLPTCDKKDVHELIDRVESELPSTWQSGI